MITKPILRKHFIDRTQLFLLVASCSSYLTR